MQETKDFANGIAFALQTIMEFEKKHGHLPVDSIASLTFSHDLKDYAILFFNENFIVVKKVTQ